MCLPAVGRVDLRGAGGSKWLGPVVRVNSDVGIGGIAAPAPVFNRTGPVTSSEGRCLATQNPPSMSGLTALGTVLFTGDGGALQGMGLSMLRWMWRTPVG